MKISVNIPIHNEEKNIQALLDSLAAQTKAPDEIIIIDDGSTDRTARIIRTSAARNPLIKYFYQKKSGRSSARNAAWKNSSGHICLMTDGDCVPRTDWIEEMIKGFSNEKIGAVAGTYATLNPQSMLANFIGYEIAWKYRRTPEYVDFHGTYNLAVRRSILEEIGGFDEGLETAEDADLTYRISQNYRILFNPRSIVGHYHPEKFWPYMEDQAQRGRDRAFLYKNHPEKITGDAYTGKIIKYQVLASGILPPSLILFFPVFEKSFLIPVAIILFLLCSSLLSFPYIAKKNLPCALFGIPLQLARNFAWFVGLCKGLLILIHRK
jgi:glycosyltransferase involved in cell wall biosynthesis